MTDRADEIAWETLLGFDRLRLDDQARVIAAALRAYVEEVAAHWKREAASGAAMLRAIHEGLGLTAGAKGGISVQDVLDRCRALAEEARREEREACADIPNRVQRCTCVGKGGVIISIHSPWCPWAIAAAIRARGEKG